MNIGDYIMFDHLMRLSGVGIGRLRAGAAGVVGLCIAAAVFGGAMAVVPSAAGQDADDLCNPGDGVQFPDVGDGDYGAGYILCARAVGLTNGKADGTFGPNQTLTRAQMAAFMARLWRDVLGKACPAGSHPFTDVSKSHFAAADIACIYQLKITTGASPDKYAPKASLTASQLTRFIIRMLNRVSSSTDMCDTSGNELAKASACMTTLNIAPSQDEARSSKIVIRAQMAVYIIGAWHHASGRGQPPAPPARPTPTTPTTTVPTTPPTPTTAVPTTSTTTTTLPASGVPATPVAPRLTALSPSNDVRRIRIAWTAPADNGHTITRYYVHYTTRSKFTNKGRVSACNRTVNSDCYQVHSAVGTATGATISVRTNRADTVWRVRLAACSTASRPWRCSRYSPVATVTVPASVAPAKPAAPLLTPGNGRIRVDWTKPADNGYPITGYHVVLQGVKNPSLHVRTKRVRSSVTRVVFTGLSNDVAYQARVSASNSSLSTKSEWSSPVTPTAPTEVPTTPAAPTLTPGDGHINVAWEVPDDSGSPITGYELSYRPAVSGLAPPTNFPASVISTSISGLTNGTTYYVKMRASNANGYSAWSQEASATPVAA